MRISSPHLVRAASAMIALASLAAAQFPMIVPYPRTLDFLVADTAIDSVWRKANRNQDGDYNDPGEVTNFYDDVTGSIQLTNPTCIAVDPRGTAYVGDSTDDIILALRDNNGDGDALALGEHWVFFDSATNASGIVMASIQGLTVDAIGNVWAAVSNAGTVGTDMILKLTDLNGDGDANDASEALVYCLIPNGAGSVGNSIPTMVVVAPDGNLYYTEVGSTGLIQKGVWKLPDLNANGDCNDPGEVTLFWAPPAVNNAFYWGLAVDRAGAFYVTDHGNEQVWRAQDLDNSGTISSGEETLFYQATSATWWDVMIRDDGVIYLCEDDTPDRIIALQDQNGDLDAMDAGESWNVYDETISGTDTRPSAGVFMRGPSLDAVPSAVRLGQSTNLVTTTPKPGDFAGLILSDQVAPVPLSLAPLGWVELNPNLLIAVTSGASDALGYFTVPLTIPNNPSLVGSLAFQSVAGDLFRPYLANAVTLTILP